MRPIARPVDVVHEEWRTGRKLGRTIYAQIGEKPSNNDVLIGMMDDEDIAAHIVTIHNVHRM